VCVLCDGAQLGSIAFVAGRGGELEGGGNCGLVDHGLLSSLRHFFVVARLVRGMTCSPGWLANRSLLTKPRSGLAVRIQSASGALAGAPQHAQYTPGVASVGSTAAQFMARFPL
jgi:hypothetical protein